MPQYIYTAVNASGKEQKGKIVAASAEEATEILKKQQLFITSLKDADAKKRAAAKKGKGAFKISLASYQVVLVCREFTGRPSVSRRLTLEVLSHFLSRIPLDSQQAISELRTVFTLFI